MEANAADRICPNCRKPLAADVPLGLCPECLIRSGFPTGTEPGRAGAAGTRFVPPPLEEIAKLFPQLEILALIGQGGMGAVYQARQPALNRFVALKVLPPATASDPGFAERFNREARALAQLNHPNIVAVHDFGKAGALHYLVMEFVDGTNLREVERAGRLAPEQALAIVPQICEALQFAHNEGIVHRDIKPENILLDKRGRVKITDFGIAKMVGMDSGAASLTGARDVIGTPHYMAPEQVEKPRTVDHRADIYSLGVVFYELLTGELPLGKFSPPSAKVQIDVRLDEVVMRTLEKEPERRYQHASQVKQEVETIATRSVAQALRREVVSESTVARWVKYVLFVSGPLVLVVGTRRLTTLDLSLPQLYIGLLLLVILSLLLVGFGFLLELRVRSRSPEQAAINEAEWRNPDNWSLGFYFSKRDSRALWVPRRIRWLGWTINLGRWQGATVLLGVIILFIAAVAFEANWLQNAGRKNAGSTGADSAPAEFREEATHTVASVPPVVVETFPVSGARDVEPGEKEIRVRFSKNMADGSWSWSSAWEDSSPESAGPIRYEPDQRTCVLKARLEPGRTYGWWLNTEKFRGFKDQDGRPAVPYLLIFRTRPDPVSAPRDGRNNAGTNAPRVIAVSPADGATDVDVKQELRLRFDQSMNPEDLDISWQAGGFLPAGQPRYEPDSHEFVVPVRLMPGQTHKLQINWMDGISGGFRGANFTPASEYHWQFTAKSAEAKTGAAKPAVVRISPPAGETLPVLTLLEITFDQPMMPLDQGFPWLRKTGSPFDLPALVPAFDYDPSAHRFTVPVALPPDNDTKLTLEGFYSADGVAGDPVSIRCQIGTDSISRPQQERIATAARDPRLEQLLSSMQSARARLHSGMETVQGTRYRAEKGSFRSISTDSAIFKWQGTNQIFGDISGIMNLKAFILGTDGMTCWLYAENQAKNERRLDSSPAALVSNINTSVADPFALTRRTVAEAIAKEGLVYLGPATVDGRACHHVQSWKVQLPQYEHDRVFAARLEWWIDAETSLPAQVVEISQYAVSTARFRYAQLNQPMPDAAFQPPAGPEQVGQPLFFKQAPAPDETRFLTIRDGCDGRMSGRLGWSGPGGTTSSGLN